MKKLLIINFICIALMLITGTLLVQEDYQFMGMLLFVTASVGSIIILNDMTEKLS